MYTLLPTSLILIWGATSHHHSACTQPQTALSGFSS